MDFVCQIPTCSESLFIQVNGVTVVPFMNLSNINSSQMIKLIPGLDSREYGGNVTCVEYDGGENYTVNFWITVNNESLEVVNYVNCKIGSHTLSDNAYITVHYPSRLRESVCANEDPTYVSRVSTSNSNWESELTSTTHSKVTKPAISLILLILCLHIILILS